MMIAGDSEGTSATHPTVAQRVAALARVTGSMVWNSPHAPGERDWTTTTPKLAVERLAGKRSGTAADAILRVRQGDDQNWLGLTFGGTIALVLTIGALAGLHPEDLRDPDALMRRFDPRPLLAGPQRFHYAMAGYKAERRSEGPSMADTRIYYRGQSGQMPPVAVVRTGDGLYRYGERETHAPPQALVIAETDRLGCFVRDPKPMEANGPLPMSSDGATQDKVAEIRSDIERVAHETRSPLGWAGVSYYLEMRENEADEAWMYYGRPGLVMAREAFNDLEGRAAVDTVRRVVVASQVPADWSPVKRAKLGALLRHPDNFVPCRSLATNG